MKLAIVKWIMIQHYNPRRHSFLFQVLLFFHLILNSLSANVSLKLFSFINFMKITKRNSYLAIQSILGLFLSVATAVKNVRVSYRSQVDWRVENQSYVFLDFFRVSFNGSFSLCLPLFFWAPSRTKPLFGIVSFFMNQGSINFSQFALCKK